MSDHSPKLKSSEFLSTESFEAFLTWLDPDRKQAGYVYEQLRKRLKKLLQCQGCATSDDLVDEVFHRVARKVAEKTPDSVADPFIFCHGFARNVLFEYWRKHERAPTDSVDQYSPERLPRHDPQASQHERETQRIKELRRDCLKECVDKLDPDARKLFFEYHQDLPGTKIDHREQMARRLGIPINIPPQPGTRLGDGKIWRVPSMMPWPFANCS